MRGVRLADEQGAGERGGGRKRGGEAFEKKQRGGSSCKGAWGKN